MGVLKKSFFFFLVCASFLMAGFIPIEGTFIQAWMYARWDEPGYIGPKDAWDKEASYWKSLGITQVIDGDIAYKNAGDPNWRACYDSKLDSVVVECYDKDIIFAKAKKYGWKVYIGMGVDNDWWNWDLTNDEHFLKFKAAMMKAGAFAHELYDIYNTQYPENFGGFYSVYEVWNHNKFNYGDSIRNLYADRLAEGFNIVIDSLNKIDPTKPLLFSQFATDDPHSFDISEGGPYGFGTLENNEKFWTRFYEKANFREQDKNLPMDAVGGGGQRIETVEPWTKAYGDAVKNANSPIDYYANIESFQQPPYHFLYDTKRTPLYGQNYNSPAPVGRFARQIAVAQRHTKGIFNFAFSHYHSPVNSIPGYYNVLLNYLQTQKGDEMAPRLPDSIIVIDTLAKNIALSQELGRDVIDKVFKFYWVGASDDNGIHRVKLNRMIEVNGVVLDSTFAYSVSASVTSGKPAHEPDSMYFAHSTGRECIGLEYPEEEDCYNPRFKGEADYRFIVQDVWGNETFSKPFTLKSTGGRTTIIPELDTIIMYEIPEKDTLRSYFAIDSAWTKEEPKPTGLKKHPFVSKNGMKLVRNGNTWCVHFVASKSENYRLSVYTPSGARMLEKEVYLNQGENLVPLPGNALGYSRFYIQIKEK